MCACVVSLTHYFVDPHHFVISAIKYRLKYFRLNTLIEEDEDENSSVTIEIANISKLNQVVKKIYNHFLNKIIYYYLLFKPRVHLQPLDNIFYYLEKANQLKSLGSSSTFVNENKETDTLNSSLKVIPCTDEYEESVLKIVIVVPFF